jgi:hypothetical protein
MIGAMSFEKTGVAAAAWTDKDVLLPANKARDNKSPFK